MTGDLDLDLTLKILLREEHPNCSPYIFGGVFLTGGCRMAVPSTFRGKVDRSFFNILNASRRYLLPAFITYPLLYLII